MKPEVRALLPLVFLGLGLAFQFWSGHEFQRRVDRDNADLRQDLKEADVSKAESAALLSAVTKLQSNASSYTQITTFIALIVTIFSIIPLYAQTWHRDPKLNRSAET